MGGEGNLLEPILKCQDAHQLISKHPLVDLDASSQRLGTTGVYSGRLRLHLREDSLQIPILAESQGHVKTSKRTNPQNNS